MKAIVAALVLACLAVAHAGDGTVLVLTKANFEETLASTPRILVEFYAPWCGHCKALAPEYDAAAEQLGSAGTLAKVDCTTEQELCSAHGVRGYPSLKFFTNGKAADYEGGRKTAAIVSFVEKQSRPAVSDLATEEEVKTFAKDDVTIVGFFDADGEGKEILASVAETLRNDFTFGSVTDKKAVADAFKVESFPSVVMFRKFESEDPQVIYSGEFTEEGLAAFIKSESFPVLGQLGPENYRKYIERGLPLVNIFTDPKSDADKKVVDAAREVAKSFKGILSVVEIDGVAYQRHATSLGLSGKTPGVVIQDTAKHTKFLFDESTTFAAEAFKTFLQQFVDGELKAFLKSAEIPEDNNGPLYTIVGKNWDELVINNDKDVLVEFYAPWCGHCKELAPKYEQLAARFADNKDVIIGKIDATENDAPGVEVQGFPTVMLFVKGDKSNPKTYSGDRTVEAMDAYLRANAKSFIPVPPTEAQAAEHEL